jgi:hypothetical protein
VSTKTQRGSHRSSRWSFGSNRAMRAVRLGIAHFTGDDTDRALPSGMTPPRALANPVTPPSSRARRPPSLAEHEHEQELFPHAPSLTSPNSHRRRSISGRGGYLPTPPPTPPLSPSG